MAEMETANPTATMSWINKGYLRSCPGNYLFLQFNNISFGNILKSSKYIRKDYKKVSY